MVIGVVSPSLTTTEIRPPTISVVPRSTVRGAGVKFATFDTWTRSSVRETGPTKMRKSAPLFWRLPNQASWMTHVTDFQVLVLVRLTLGPSLYGPPVTL